MKRRDQHGSVLIVAITVTLVVIFFLGIALRKPKPPTSSTPAVLTGFSYSPKSAFDSGGFFDTAKGGGNAVTWAGDWNQLSAGGPNGLIGSAKSAKLVLVPIATTHTDAGGGKVKVLRPLADNQASYIDKAAAYASKNSPVWMGLGIEVNRIWESSPAEFDQFVELFNQTYDKVKAASPNTHVFTVFQLERLKGLHGGLFGGTNDTAQGEWALLDKFSKADALAFTTYPGLIYKSPAEIPIGYYSELPSRTNKPILFTEIGWSSDLSVAGWQSDTTEQQQFVARFAELTANMTVPVSIWSFLFDQKLPVPFTGMGLYASDGTAKPAWTAWQEYAKGR